MIFFSHGRGGGGYNLSENDWYFPGLGTLFYLHRHSLSCSHSLIFFKGLLFFFLASNFKLKTLSFAVASYRNHRRAEICNLRLETAHPSIMHQNQRPLIGYSKVPVPYKYNAKYFRELYSYKSIILSSMRIQYQWHTHYYVPDLPMISECSNPLFPIFILLAYFNIYLRCPHGQL